MTVIMTGELPACLECGSLVTEGACGECVATLRQRALDAEARADAAEKSAAGLRAALVDMKTDCFMARVERVSGLSAALTIEGKIDRALAAPATSVDLALTAADALSDLIEHERLKGLTPEGYRLLPLNAAYRKVRRA